MSVLDRWVNRAADHPPPGPFRAGFWRSPLRGPWFTAILSVALLPGITLNTSPTDYRPIKDGYMVEFRDSQLAVISELLHGGS